MSAMSGSARDDQRIGQVKAIRDPRMRSAKMTELLGGDDENVVIFLHQLLKRSGGPNEPHADVLDALVVALSARPAGGPDGAVALSYDKRASLYAAAVGRGDVTVARLFLEADSEQSDAGDIEATIDAARPVVPRGRPLSLGERKALARGPRNDRFLHLLRDPHPDVVQILLGNPHLVESDILAIAARRPTLGRCQRAVLHSDRWRARYRVKRALVLNPYSPPAIGVRLTACLTDTDLRLVARDNHLAMLVRQQARGLLDLRRNPTSR